MPQLRTYLRIEGELVSHVTEKVDREVELSALLDEVVRNQPISTGRLPANTRFLVRLGEREAYVLEQPPMRRVIEFHATQRSGSEPATNTGSRSRMWCSSWASKQARSRASPTSFAQARSARSTISSPTRACRTRRTTASSASVRYESRADPSAKGSMP